MAITPHSFEFVSYELNATKRKAEFNYKIHFKNQDPLEFTETLEFFDEFKNKPGEYTENVMHNLHLALGLSYYKLYVPTTIILNKPISRAQAEFWDTVYLKGLGEFLYRNNLDPQQIAKFPHKNENTELEYGIGIRNNERALVGIGGGKDSIVTGELLKENGHEFDGFIIETEKDYPIADEVLKIMNVGSIKVRRKLDPKIFEEHPESYNGHIPISAIFAFIGLLTAQLYDYSYFIVSNEYSSNFGNLDYKGLTINHQWSKSQEFETMFQDYTRDFIGTGITYFSAIRPFYEIRVVEMFSKFQKYFNNFSSCNNAYKVHKKRSDKLWCNNCAKCVFIYTLLSAYLNKNELLQIFGENLYDREDLLNDFKDILGLGNLKPFDCVGTFDECQTAFKIAETNFKDSYIIKELANKVNKHEEVLYTHKTSTTPTKFWNLGMKSVYILGYGKEGKITEKFLQKHFPNIQIKIGDLSLDENYLKNQVQYDFAIKTPGIHKDKVTIPYTTATNLFFEKYRDQIIGITGSKGKSTTTSLIYHILKHAGKNAKLLGNIGNPMLEEYDNIKKDDILVIELSSYQLDDIKFSPHIAVLTNLFPEHMNFHGGKEPYYKAKQNIVKFQTKDDFFIDKTNDWQTNAKKIDYTKEIHYESELLGDHNKENIKAAIATTRLFDIPEEKIKEAIATFKGLPHRLEFVGKFNEILFYDDAISTTPQSTIEAIKALPDTQTILLGGEDRGYDFKELEKVIHNSNIKNVVLFPNSGEKILKDSKQLNILKTDSMQEAVKFAYKYTEAQTICLLSCASPSYSLWKNFEEKGDEFKRLVHRLAKEI